MSHRLPRRLGRGVIATAAGLALTATMSSPGWAAPQEGPISSPDSSSSDLQRLQDLKVAGSLKDAAGEVSVYVQFEGEGAFAQTQTGAAQRSLSAPKDQAAKVKQIRNKIKAQAKSVAAQADAKVMYETTNALPGVALTGQADELKELAKRSDVKKISAIVPKHPLNKGTDIDTGTLASWQKLDQTGEGITIAVLDTGIDYTHAAFGGPGTLEAYKKAQASEAMPGKKSGLYDPNKFIGGWDLVGDDYDANPNNETYQPIPHPDPNPLDCESAGHGSHVAGTAAGYGVGADGKTFKGDYSSLTEQTVQAMRIGPGSAPDASLVGIRVFGCKGSSNVVGQALDYVLDPNGDGNFDDRAQVVNMSLGSDYSPVDDPENDIVDALTAQGILSVVASGNAADVTNVGGSPGNSRSSLTVANSVGSTAASDATDVTAPADLAGTYGSQLSSNFAWKGAVTGDVVVPATGEKTTGCEAITDPNVKGKWVWLHWTDDPTGAQLPCGSAARFNNAQAAGAAGVVLDSPTDTFTAGIAGNAGIPGVQLTKTSAEKLLAAAKAGTLKVSVDPAKRSTVSLASGAKDTLNPSSSRGVHGSNGVVKPDVAAPGTAIPSVGVGSGNGAATMTGTSMATPHVAGIAALVASSGNYTAYEVKNIVMNTAATDIMKGQYAYGPNRVGSGRVMADAALKDTVIAYDKAAPDLVSTNFGVIEATSGQKKLSRTIELRNLSNKTRNYDVKYIAATTMPGVSITTDKKKVSVPSKGRAEVKVTVTIKPKALVKKMDPTMDARQLDLARQYLADASGRVQFTEKGQPTLRVPVSVQPKPTTDISAKSVKINANGTTQVKLGGRGVDQGDGAEQYLGKVSTFTLGAESPRQGKELDAIPASRQMDLMYVGANSTAPSVGTDNARLDFGVSTWGNWAALPSETQLQVDIDTDGDKKADFAAFNSYVDDLDLNLVVLRDLKTGKNVSNMPLNGVFGDVDTNTFDTNVAVLPVQLAKLGLKGSKINYRVSTWSSYHSDEDGKNTPVDGTDWIAYDTAAPAVNVQSQSTTVVDAPGSQLNLKVRDKEAKLLMLHHLNPTGDLSATKQYWDGGKAEVIRVGK